MKVATFTERELALAVEIHQLVRRLNSLTEEARRLGLGVALRLVEGPEVYEPGLIDEAPGAVAPDVELKVLVFKAILVEAANATSAEEPDAVLPHGWMG